jgi:iron complex outermembrane receptor protein
MYDREFTTTIAHTRTSIGDGSTLAVSVLRKAFGANNFYGGNAPSQEWTNQTLVSADHRFGPTGGWSLAVNGAYRTHGDRFLFNRERPTLSDNRHRTHALLASMTAARPVGSGGSLTAGLDGGFDVIRSTNLGDHDVSRVSAFGEWRQEIAARIQLDATLRVDGYTEFGASWSPSLGMGWALSDVVRLRASVGRAFRVPTFTERYYSDPANLARPEVGPEHAWAAEAGADVVLPRGWIVQGTVFGRADDDVIDWLRPTTVDRWRTYNVRDVDTFGVELSARRMFASGAFVQAQVTALAVDAASVTQLSKYVLDYAPRSVTGAALIPLPSRFHLSPRIEYRRRTRSTGSSDYVLLDARIGRRFGRLLDLSVEGTNLLDADYQEVAGVAMPGAAMVVALRVAR